jgi:uncharacterized alpha-E superfamily protein
VQIAGGGELFRELHPSPSIDTAERFFVAARHNPSSVRSSLAFARESVRTTRDIVPSEAFRSINELCLWVTQSSMPGRRIAPLRHHSRVSSSVANRSVACSPTR